MRLLLVAAMPFPAPLGSQVYVATQAAALAAAGHEVTLAVYGAGVGDDPRGVRVLRTPARPATTIRSGPQRAKLAEDPALWRLVREAGRHVDVVHAHHVEAALIARAASPTPLVYDAHTALTDELPDWFPRWRRLAARVGQGIDAAIPRLADATIALSEGGAAQLRAAGARRVRVIAPPIDASPFADAQPERFRAAYGLGARPWVAYAGNLDAYQRWPLLIDAIARLPDAGLLMLISGDPGPAYRAVAGLPTDRVRVVQAGLEDLRDGLAAASLAVVPRSRCAGFPIKLLNQLALGVPSVVARGAVDSMPGVVAFEPEDAVDLARVVGGLLGDPTRREDLGRAGAAHVAIAHAPELAAASLGALYRDVLASRAVTPRVVSA